MGPGHAGGRVVKRGAPTVWNAAYNPRQFWDGRAADLEEQARFPITSPLEMDQRPDELVSELRAIPEYVSLFDEAFDRSEEHTSELQSLTNLVCRLLLEKKKKTTLTPSIILSLHLHVGCI